MLTIFFTSCRYKERVSYYSAIMRDLPPAKERAIFWIEHVLKFGGEHLRAHVFELNFIQYYLIDVAVFLIVLVVFFYHMFRCMCRLCCNVGKRICKRNSHISRNPKQDWSRSITDKIVRRMPNKNVSSSLFLFLRILFPDEYPHIIDKHCYK